MVNYITSFLEDHKGSNCRLLNIGAGMSLAIEEQIEKAGHGYISDRIDVEECSVVHGYVDKSYLASIENAECLNADTYALAMSNYVLEHVAEVAMAAKEIYRVLKQDGVLVFTIPNPTAPEIILSRMTPLWFHRLARGGSGWKTYYNYGNSNRLVRIFNDAGFSLVKVEYFPALHEYVSSVPIINSAAKYYDKYIEQNRINILMGSMCVVFKKNAE